MMRCLHLDSLGFIHTDVDEASIKEIWLHNHVHHGQNRRPCISCAASLEIWITRLENFESIKLADCIWIMKHLLQVGLPSLAKEIMYTKSAILGHLLKN